MSARCPVCDALFLAVDNNDTISDAGYVKVPLAELELEQSLLIARVNQIRRQLGRPPLLTGKEERRQQAANNVR